MRCSVDLAECVPGRLKRGMCELHYRRFQKTGTTTLVVRKFESYYDILSDGRWWWTGPLYRNGYGHSPARFGDRLAHRAAWVTHRGPIPSGAELDHVLHNLDPACPGGDRCYHRRDINPDHLELTDKRSNQRRNWRRSGLCRAKLHDLTQPENVRYRADGTRICIPCYRAKCTRSNVKRGTSHATVPPIARPERVISLV